MNITDVLENKKLIFCIKLWGLDNSMGVSSSLKLSWATELKESNNAELGWFLFSNESNYTGAVCDTLISSSMSNSLLLYFSISPFCMFTDLHIYIIDECYDNLLLLYHLLPQSETDSVCQ